MSEEAAAKPDEVEEVERTPRLGARRRASSEPPHYEFPDVLPGGGFQGLAVRFNIVYEGLARTQAFVGGAAAEAEQIMSHLGFRIARIEHGLGITDSPPSSPKGDGAQSPRCQDADESAANVDESAAEAADGKAESPKRESAQSPRCQDADESADNVDESAAEAAHGKAEQPAGTRRLGSRDAGDPTDESVPEPPGPEASSKRSLLSAYGVPEPAGDSAAHSDTRDAKKMNPPAGRSSSVCSTTANSAATNSRSISPETNLADHGEGIGTCLRARLEALELELQALDKKVKCTQPHYPSRVEALEQMVHDCVQQVLEVQICHLQEDLQGYIREGFQHCSGTLMAELSDSINEQLKELTAPATAKHEDALRRLNVQDSALSCLEDRVNALRNDTDEKIEELSLAQRALEAGAKADRASKMCTSPSRGGSGMLDNEVGSAEIGLAQGVTALARMLGIMRKGETLGSNDWAWDRCNISHRLEQAWNVRALELGVAPGVLGRSDLFDLLREVQRPSAGSLVGFAADAAAGCAGTAYLPDKREAARLQAWLQSPPVASQHPQQRPSSASTRERSSGFQSPLSTSQPLPHRAASWASLEEASNRSDKGFSQTMPLGGHAHGEDVVRCGSGFRGVAGGTRRATSAAAAAVPAGSRPPRP